MTWPPEQRDDHAIVKFEGRPNEPTHSGEKSRWAKFKRLIWPFAKRGGEWAKYGAGLGTAFAEAEVAKKENEAAKLAAEAADTAAAADLKRAEKVKVVNDEIERIFTDPDVPNEAKTLQLANLLQDNPELAQQVERVGELINQLRLKRNVHVELKALPAAERVTQAKEAGQEPR